jgi:hypothetical protein
MEILHQELSSSPQNRSDPLDLVVSVFIDQRGPGFAGVIFLIE